MLTLDALQQKYAETRQAARLPGYSAFVAHPKQRYAEISK